jgi:hypothetical protein
MNPPDDHANPYQSPAVEPSLPPLPLPGAGDLVMVKKFRDQIHALGALWLVIGGVGTATGVVLLVPSGGQDLLPGSVLIAMGTLWLAVGLFSLSKQMWAVYTGMVLSYLMLASAVLQLSPCFAVFFVLVVIQCHRVVGWAKQMRARGVPLTASVEQLL